MGKSLLLVKYGHDFCGPCKMLEPILRELAGELETIMDYSTRNTYEMNPEELEQAGIRAVPTLILFKNGTEVWRHVGLISKDVLANQIRRFE